MKFSPTEWEQENIKNCEESKSTVAPFTECNRGHLPSQASGLRVSGTFSLNSPSSQREAVTLSDTQQLAGAKDSGSRVGHDTGGPRLALAATGLPMGQFSTRPPPPRPGFPQTTRLGHKKVAGLSLQENEWGPEDAPRPCVLRGLQEDGTAHRKTRPQRTVSTPLGSLRSPSPKGERRKQPAAGGHDRPLWTRSQRTGEAPVPKHLPRGAGRDTVWRRR